jgi:hypothetical protein
MTFEGASERLQIVFSGSFQKPEIVHQASNQNVKGAERASEM